MIPDGTATDAGMSGASASSIDARLAAATALWQRDEVAPAGLILHALHIDAPARADVATLLAEVLRSQGRLTAACGVWLDACTAGGFEASASLRAATFAQQCDRHSIAAAICTGALALDGRAPGLQALAGHVARESGDFESARVHYLAALDAGVDLDQHHVLGALANTRRYRDAADPDIARFERWFRGAHPARSRASAGFALAKAQDDLGDCAAAARTLREANALVRSGQAFDAGAWRAFVAARRADVVARIPATPDAAFIPVFIVGVPRTGTTLTASLLAQSSSARDRGELRTLRYIADQLIAGGQLGNAAALSEAASLYRRLAVQDDAPTVWYLDQDPLNFRYLDIAAALFPQAKVLHLRRDPRDTALSLWSQDFAHPDMAFAYDFDDIKAYMAGHDALMHRWSQAACAAIHEVAYAELVADPQATLATLRAFIGAPALDHVAVAAAAPVQSASVWQARQPVYSTSVGRWQRYAPYVPELGRFG